jgi:hypothetical protein
MIAKEIKLSPRYRYQNVICCSFFDDYIGVYLYLNALLGWYDGLVDSAALLHTGQPFNRLALTFIFLLQLSYGLPCIFVRSYFIKNYGL